MVQGASAGSMPGIASIGSHVSRDCGRRITASAARDASMRLRFITTTKSAMYSTTPIVCVMNRYDTTAFALRFVHQNQHPGTNASSAAIEWAAAPSKARNA